MRIHRLFCYPLVRSDPTPGSLSPRCFNLFIGHSKHTVSRSEILAQCKPIGIHLLYSVVLCNYSSVHCEDLICTSIHSFVRIPDRQARGLSVESVKLARYYLETSKPEYSRSRFTQGVDHRGLMNCKH
ncbi:hypothetical protein CDL15_Pgr001220 [Punica granatum]|uniref:Uncharacterized protein n=1 Tax=Punica granatum TaxID=22663 RepID=A0A218WKD5_PUNGR|nr:hypothetical protein CDL15_Pgr001220 [Punica granatum]PKI59690.1 hypothetical protein CRG98_019917 [Punica granatum]